MRIFKCTKCCNFGPGNPCIIYMDKDTPEPTFCPSDDGKYPGAEWIEFTEQAVKADAESRADCGYCGVSVYEYCPRCGKKRTA